jgi:hypothetical protein
MTPGEIRACHRLYAAHRKSRKIFTFAGAISAMNNIGHPGDLAVLLRLHTGLDGLARDIGHGDLNDDLHPAVAGHVEPQTRLLNRVRFSAMQKIIRPAH